MTPSRSDDIPEALRDSGSSNSRSPSASGVPPLIWIGVVGGVAVALGAATAVLWQPLAGQLSQRGLLLSGAVTPDNSRGAASNADPGLGEADAGDPDRNGSDPISTTATQTENGGSLPDDDGLLGHRAYEEAPRESLTPIVADASILLRDAAAQSFIAMSEAARADGIQLQPLSGFRTESEQSYLFFEIKKQRKQTPSERATVSAPPGYSEHHTGYAIDIGEVGQPETHLEESFRDTDAFQWLQDNAAAYGFELSFEGGRGSSVSYEPWHWRFVGDRHSLETFYGDDSVLEDGSESDGESEPEDRDIGTGAPRRTSGRSTAPTRQP